MPTDPLALPESERDRLAATKVLGWTVEQKHFWRDGVSMMRVENFLPGKNSHQDYAILRKVRETWSVDDKQYFGHALIDAMAQRVELEVPIELGYEPGMWRDAALLVLAEKGEI